MKIIGIATLCALAWGGTGFAQAIPFTGGTSAQTLAYEGAGGYAVPPNCGFTAEGPNAGWISFRLRGDHPEDAGITSTPPIDKVDIWVVPGEFYPLNVRELFLYDSASQGGSPGVTFDASCASAGYTHAFNVDDACETDPDRPSVADPGLVTPGPNLPFNSTVYTSVDCEVDVIRWGVGDFTYWTTVQSHAGLPNLAPYGARRCRWVDGGCTFLTMVAP